ncbi:DUF4118 domain-containing protein [Zunongwangia profunda]|uniref:DUF4118 domain-containing protein n=1 Tax=Zunongwangia profunda TaxID=398743 RepID=UPI000C912FB9|nr:DUF4118 domain-containing protein [Zunongwangia profunda]MAG88187.1 hypothetical protein [Flavobacteriaceae bacterium]MCC4229512.1 DUF4118 domain-containing protein [Zunongwangia profunda]|tara:strand:+ start:15352 stop:15723 length:372 start_codon:yes stop_codon:yes gene_type:complete
MKSIFSRDISKTKQYAISISIILIASVSSYFFHDLMGYRAVALLLLLAVSLSAVLFDILPVLVCALLSALFLKFFFILPTFTFKIELAEDVLMFLMYLLVAMIHGYILKIKNAIYLATHYIYN